MFSKNIFGSILFYLTSLLFLAESVLAQPDFFVDASATGAANGLSWTNAFPALDQALAASDVGDVIWVAAGVYTPRTRTINNDPRSVTFVVGAGRQIFGGFDGTEVLFSQRAELFEQTVLSGEINNPAITDNAYHVLTMENNTVPTTVDGVKIERGCAIGGPDQNGGAARSFNATTTYYRNCIFESNSGMDGGALQSQLTLIDTVKCTFQGNTAERDGGAVSVQAARYRSSNCFYFDNVANRFGGAVRIRNSSTTIPSVLLNCVFDNNMAERRGGAIQVAAGNIAAGGAIINPGNLRVVNCTVHGNLSQRRGGGLFANESAIVPAQIEVSNSIFWENTAAVADDQIGGVFSVDFCDVQGGYAGNSNIDANPSFVNAIAGNFRLRPTSPCIDTGNTNLLLNDILDVDEDSDFVELVPLDVYDTPRIQLQVVDIGADESSTIADPPGGGSDDGGPPTGSGQ